MYEPCLAESMHLGNITTFSLRNQVTGDKMEFTVDRNGEYSLSYSTKEGGGVTRTIPVAHGKMGSAYTAVVFNHDVEGLL